MMTYRRILLRICVASVILYIAILCTLIKLENRLVYPGAYMAPTRAQPIEIDTLMMSRDSADLDTAKAEPGDVKTQQDQLKATNEPSDGLNRGHAIKDVGYRTCDGLLLWGRLLETKNLSPSRPKNVVLVLHGNASRAANLNERLKRLAHWLEADVMAGEYRGYEDDHRPSEKGLEDDCKAAMDFLCQRYQLTPNQIIIFGTSLGGGCATALAANRGAKAVILDRTFDRLVDVAAEKYPIFPIRSIMKNRYDSVSQLQRYRGPLIMIHGDRDEVVSIDRGRNLFERAACMPKHWIEVPGLSHMMRLPDETLAMVQKKVQEIDRSPPTLSSPLDPNDGATDAPESREFKYPRENGSEYILNLESESSTPPNATQE